MLIDQSKKPQIVTSVKSIDSIGSLLRAELKFSSEMYVPYGEDIKSHHIEIVSKLVYSRFMDIKKDEFYSLQNELLQNMQLTYDQVCMVHDTFNKIYNLIDSGFEQKFIGRI